VAGGFELQEVAYLLFEVVKSGRQIIGFDLNEVAPGETGDWDANVGARALWHLVCATEYSRRKHSC
jgi:agmatinase